MAEAPSLPAAGPRGPVARIVTLWALLGGLLVLAVVLLNAASILGAALLTRPVPGDFELTQMGICVAVFTFLPWCQLTGANVTADIFTSRASRRWLAVFGLAAALVALVFALFLGWRMYFGLLDQYDYGYRTTILQVPIWYAYVPILVSLALLALAAAVTLRNEVRRI